MNSKKELFEHLKTIEDKSGGFKKPESIKKNYPEIYNGIISSNFPTHWSFTQKLWHFLQDDFSIHKCECGKELHFIDFKKGYRTYCSRECPCVMEYNKTTLQKAQEISRRPESRKKAVDTILEKNGGKFWTDENLEKLKLSYQEKKECIIKKRRDTIMENILNAKDLYGKSIKGGSSQVEMDFYKYLINIFGFENVEPQYLNKSVYPYACDFYISNVNIYVEIQGSWTHGGHPYDKKSLNDIQLVQEWKDKHNEYYNNAVYTWTDLDVRKRKKAKSSGINYLEIFSHDLNECISIFKEYILKIIVDYCLSQNFPGNSKWPSEHPIWNCSVGKNISPLDAWKREEYLIKAVKNIFDMLNYDDKFKRRHIKEFFLCKIENNRIISSRKQFLERILDRFTIAKIAPKVTALSSKELKRIIDESGIDISKGVYIPMAGFGGIVEGSRMWGDEHNMDIDIEAYDINPKFCEWYGWEQRDMLKQKIKTDKVCICCPPFGKKYEHWEGTPKEMSERSFNDWYKLIKEYIDAPEYIIIGPEIGGKENVSGLFKKKVGIMLYNDTMID